MSYEQKRSEFAKRLRERGWSSNFKENAERIERSLGKDEDEIEKEKLEKAEKSKESSYFNKLINKFKSR